mmetsp:Transcript_7075/g.8147  ORF Transcript_7075/g.8147 Transcript_7075/m.8147 type:complete len:88 (-) Transcript_7075:175-438(-)
MAHACVCHIISGSVSAIVGLDYDQKPSGVQISHLLAKVSSLRTTRSSKFPNNLHNTFMIPEAGGGSSFSADYSINLVVSLSASSPWI